MQCCFHQNTSGFVLSLLPSFCSVRACCLWAANPHQSVLSGHENFKAYKYQAHGQTVTGEFMNGDLDDEDFKLLNLIFGLLPCQGHVRPEPHVSVAAAGSCCVVPGGWQCRGGAPAGLR